MTTSDDFQSDHRLTARAPGGASAWIGYSCIIGGYDRLVAGGAAGSKQADPDARFLCFADPSLKVPAPWELCSIGSPKELVSGHEINRYHKFFPQRVLPACDFSIYHDGNIVFDADYAVLVERLRERGAAIGAFRHPAGRTLEEEVVACRAQGKLNSAQAEVAAQQLASYAQEGFAIDEVISANYLLVRDHRHPALGPAMDLWWEQITRFTGRDQLSLGYVIWKTGLPFVFLDDEGAEPVRLPHSGARWRKRWERLRSRFTGSNN